MFVRISALASKKGLNQKIVKALYLFLIIQKSFNDGLI